MSGDGCVSYVEDDQNLGVVPVWVRWFIELGLKYPPRRPGISSRSILLVSTPCDSAAAGLISLGIVMRDLARQDASDEQSYAESIRSWAKQYVQCCQDCKQRCKPKYVQCGFSEASTGEVFEVPRGHGGHRNKFTVESLDESGTLTFREVPKANSRKAPIIMRFGKADNPDAALGRFHPQGWALPETPPNRAPLSKVSFSSLAAGWTPEPKNLTQSYSGACLVGRRAGTVETRRVLQNAGFSLHGITRDLSEMLSIMDWGEDSVSRLVFFNSRGAGGFDRQGVMPEIAVVDGARELAEVIGAPVKFGKANLIGVVPRDSDEESLESLSLACNEYLTGFREDDFLSGEPRPSGVSIRWMTAK